MLRTSVSAIVRHFQPPRVSVRFLTEPGTNARRLMPQSRVRSFRSLAMLLALLAGCQTSTEPAIAPPAEAEAVTLRETTPEEVTQWLADQQGKVVVVDIWATWCPPCVKEFPGLVTLSKKHSRDRLVCASLSCDYQGLSEYDSVKQRVLQFLKTQQATVDNFIVTVESDQLFRHLDIVSVPVIDVYATDGSLHKRFDLSNGIEFTYDDVNRVVDELLRPPARG